jgi:hypothetical protein
MDRQERNGAMPWRYIFDAHPPWAHWLFFAVWVITASLGPIAVVVGLLQDSSSWLIGLAIWGVALVTMGIDWLVVRRLRRRNPSWTPWTPPRWLSDH